jgi:DNA-binding protein YbaB
MVLICLSLSIKKSWHFDLQERQNVRMSSTRDEQQLERVQRLRRDVAEVTVTSRSRKGEVSVEVGAQGQLRDIRFKPQALTKLNAQKPAHLIMTVVAEATKEAAAQAMEMTAAFLPDDMAARLRDGERDLISLLPMPPRIQEAGEE